MKLPSLGRVSALACLSLTLAGFGPAAANTEADGDWTATTGDLGRTTSRFALHVGGNWSAIQGIEVEKMDTAVGYEASLSARLLGSYSVFGSYAVSSGDVDGQVTELLDQHIRPDRRSGNVSGEIEFRRFRAGIRVDGLRSQSWRLQTYFLGAAVFSTMEATLDTVDGAPPRPVPLPGGGAVDVSNFEDTGIGGLGRFGLEYRLLPLVGMDVNFTYESFEFPTGTSAATSVNGGLTIRI